MNTSIKILLIFFTLIVSNNTFSQKKERIKISGYVKDSLNKPIKDCVIFIDDVKQKKKTNKKGFYNLKLNKVPQKITFYSSNHGLTEINYPGKRIINVKFKKMGIKEETKYSKLFKVEKENKNRFRFNDIYSYLRGQVAGVRVLPDNTIIVRGVTSLKGSNQPLFVLNKLAITLEGLEYINPKDIKSVKVIKGSEATMWGVRGSAGVIMITTY